jgi:hypothetical protein
LPTLVSTGQTTIYDQNDAYTLTITGGTRAYVYNAAGNTATPSASAAFAITLQKGSTTVTPSSYSWTGTGMLITGTPVTTPTFTPTVVSIYNVTNDTTVNVTVVHEGNSISQTVPIAISKVGDTGAAGIGTYTLNFTTAAYGSDQSTVLNTREFDGWDSQAYSVQGYVGSAYCSAKSTSIGNYFAFGLNSDPASSTSFTSIDYAWYAEGGGNTAAVYESGTQQTSFEAYTADTVFSIFYDGTNVKYYLDGVLKRTVARATGAALYLDCSFYKVGKGLTSLVFGSGGATGQSNHRIYIAAASSSATPTTPSTTTSGATPALWSSSPVALTGTQAQFQSDGVTPAGSTTTTWGTPYLSYFKVDTLEAITTNTGNLTVSGSIKAYSGTAPSVSGTTMTNAGAIINSNGTFALGDSTNNITYNGSAVTFNGKIVSPTNVTAGTYSGSGWSGNVAIGGTAIPSFYAYRTTNNSSFPIAQIDDSSTGSTYPALRVYSSSNVNTMEVSNSSSSSGGAALSLSQSGSQVGSYGLVVNTASNNTNGTNLITATGTSAIGLLVKSTGSSGGASKFFNTGAYSNSKAVTFTASTNKVSATAHGFANDSAVVFNAITGGAGISAGTIYYVINTAANDFEVTTIQGGTTLDITTDGSATAGIPRQLWAAPGGYAAYSPSGGGTARFPDGVGTFTGFHNVLVPKTITLQLGECLVDSEVIYRLDISNVLFSAEHSDIVEQSGVIGIVSRISEIHDLVGLPEELRNQYKATHWLVDINALGEGQILVSGKAGNIQKGDLLASGVSGIAQKQSSNQVFNYTVAKARESVNFSSSSEVKMIACIYMCG